MTSALGIVGRLAVALILAAAILAVTTVAAFFVLGSVFGFIGHPAGPNLPAGCYTAYLVGGPVLALAAALWLVFAFGRHRPAT